MASDFFFVKERAIKMCPQNFTSPAEMFAEFQVPQCLLVSRNGTRRHNPRRAMAAMCGDHFLERGFIPIHEIGPVTPMHMHVHEPR